MSWWRSLLPSIYCINLVSRPDRLKKVSSQFASVGLEVGEQVQLYQPIRHPTSGPQGCYESHQALAQRGLREAQPYITIFEDDVQFSPKLLTVANQQSLERFLTSDTVNWDVLYLGHFPLYIKPTRQPGIIKCRALGTHGYILSQQGMRKLAATPFSGIGIDEAFMQSYKCYGLHPEVCWQDEREITDVDRKSFQLPPALRFQYRPWRRLLVNGCVWVQKLLGKYAEE